MAIEVEKMYQDYGAAWASNDLDKILSFYTDDCVYEDLPSDTVCRNKDELKRFFETTLATIPDITFELISFFSSGNMLCSEYFIKGTVGGGGDGTSDSDIKLSTRTASIYELKEGKFSRVRNYYNSSF